MQISDYINWFGIFCIGVALQQALLITAPSAPAHATATATATATAITTGTGTAAYETVGISSITGATDHGESHAGLV
jgi:hypothetical protein